jgi:ubiquinone/menaquinone biosynthesis C-methylase UbiE
MAEGYAKARPPVHERVIERVKTHFGEGKTFRRALDVGCGAGLSTKALAGLAVNSIGLEPAESMLQWRHSIAPHDQFIAGAAEAIPIRDGAVDLIAAAGSLNYVKLDLFFREAARLLTPNGRILVYDFSPGRRFRDSPALDEWYSTFQSRYPRPPNEARPLDPEILARLDSGFQVAAYEYFEIALTLTPAFYIEYVLTETNVAFAVRNGAPADQIRKWCEESLRPVWNGKDREVFFSGYFACMQIKAPRPPAAPSPETSSA